MSDNKFIDGLIFKNPNDSAPDYVIAKISIKRAELIAWLRAQQGDWINADLKRSQQDKLYAAVDDWKPNGTSASRPQRQPAPTAADESEIPF